jgi:transcriptional regulator with XRE-family HTH domain
MKGSEVKRIRQALGLTQQEFADRLGVHMVTVAKWETDAQGMRGPAARLIALLGSGVRGVGTRKGTRGNPRVRKGLQRAEERKS